MYTKPVRFCIRAKSVDIKRSAGGLSDIPIAKIGNRQRAGPSVKSRDQSLITGRDENLGAVSAKVRIA
jgi:hypothetical protein